METVLIFIIVGFASVYLVRKFYRSLKKTQEPQCGCGCNSCPKEQNCNEQLAQTIHHIK
jgi:hypothetical protein